MKFDTPASRNPIDRLKVVGQPTARIDGPLKTTGTATYAYEQHNAAPGAAYGYIVGAGIAKGRIESIDVDRAKAAPGVLGIVTAANAGKLGVGAFYVARALAGPDVDHYHQAVAIVVAETFEQARAAAHLVRVRYARGEGSFDLEQARGKKPAQQPLQQKRFADTAVGDFDGAFAAAPVTLDATYTTPDHGHAMMEPHATIAAWHGDKLTLWTAIQLVSWGMRDVAKTLDIPKENIRIVSPYIGGGFGGKGSILADAVLAAVAAKQIGRPVKVTLQRALMFNNTTHRAATIQRIRIGAGNDGRITAIGHESWSGNLGNQPEFATAPTRMLYAGANRMTRLRVAHLDLPEANAMRAPGETPGMMALEIAMDEMAEKLGLDPVAFRILNDTLVDPEAPQRPFSKRQFVECLQTGAERFGWKARSARPAMRREGRWMIGMGVAAAIRGAPVAKSAASVRLDNRGTVIVETDMTDIGTGSYTIIAQTAAEMLGVGLDKVTVRLGDSTFPEGAGSGGQWGAASSTAGVYAACVKLREMIAQRLGMTSTDIEFIGGRVRAGGLSRPLLDAVAAGELVAQDFMEYGDLARRFAQQTFGAHFAEVAVDSATGEIRIRRMLAVCAAGRILNPLAARSQIIGGMTMGAGAALMEELVVDKRIGFFVNHDLASYEVPVHADIPHQEVIFLDEVDPTAGPLKAKGVGELGISGVPAAIANAVYNATGIRVRDYPVTLDKLLDRLPRQAT
ncbi:aldehyde oxidoreductase molybdenum-binding subunit PaoC [Pseudoduganella umbonata]|uniref:Xanthine dehydrogenase YagR molybdenum-binding subunit n=1 Tax=Pseudoduganella umbonata TaxID=864828 RepID=A0A4P8HLS1_9BURK|nr:aldehyde oxidoreductase molybdenum-binding subunit PaoC [Pseudoduganella umbonata]MBB3221647.1 xanthine dehydrogenase YagR molybdenum-binding subunit [Pseudoduganella umbonata]QCP09125.1 xanthine dehydrogenase family protein molybdopterin-binding subunit [Pseudoduganella umbonata]